MKKSLVALSATTLGLVGAAAAAAPAHAALPADCATTDDHAVSASATGAEDWYMDCTPLYGVGKAEFTISSGADPFPADFLPLTDPAVSSTATSTTSGAAVDTYTSTLKTPGAPAGMTNLSDVSDTPSTQTYTAYAIVPVDRASIQRLDPATPPLACSAGTFNLAYRYSTLATTTTFTQVAGGTVYTYDVVTPAATNLLYLNATAGVFDDAPQCVTDGTLAGSAYATGFVDPLFMSITGRKATSYIGTTLSPYLETGILPLISNSAVAAPAPAAALALPPMGTDPQVPTLIALALMVTGASVLIVRRRRNAA